MINLAALLASMVLLVVAAMCITAGATSFGNGRNVGFISKPKATLLLLTAMPATAACAWLLFTIIS